MNRYPINIVRPEIITFIELNILIFLYNNIDETSWAENIGIKITTIIAKIFTINRSILDIGSDR